MLAAVQRIAPCRPLSDVSSRLAPLPSLRLARLRAISSSQAEGTNEKAPQKKKGACVLDEILPKRKFNPEAIKAKEGGSKESDAMKRKSTTLPNGKKPMPELHPESVPDF
eukprot:gene1221-32562_t